MNTMKATFTAKYLKAAKFDSKMFKVVETHTDHPLLGRFIKDWEGTKMIYLKEKYLNERKTPLELMSYYRIQVSFEQFVNKEDKEITFINKIRHKAVEYVETTTELSEDDSDF